MASQARNLLTEDPTICGSSTPHWHWQLIHYYVSLLMELKCCCFGLIFEVKVISCEMERLLFHVMLSWRGPAVKLLKLLVMSFFSSLPWIFRQGLHNLRPWWFHESHTPAETPFLLMLSPPPALGTNEAGTQPCLMLVELEFSCSLKAVKLWPCMVLKAKKSCLHSLKVRKKTLLMNYQWNRGGEL